MDAADIIEQQGWNLESLVILHERFLEHEGLWDKFTAFLQEQADEENAECLQDEREYEVG